MYVPPCYLYIRKNAPPFPPPPYTIPLSGSPPHLGAHHRRDGLAINDGGGASGWGKWGGGRLSDACRDAMPSRGVASMAASHFAPATGARGAVAAAGCHLSTSRSLGSNRHLHPPPGGRLAAWRSAGGQNSSEARRALSDAARAPARSIVPVVGLGLALAVVEAARPAAAAAMAEWNQGRPALAQKDDGRRENAGTERRPP